MNIGNDINYYDLEQEKELENFLKLSQDSIKYNDQINIYKNKAV